MIPDIGFTKYNNVQYGPPKVDLPAPTPLQAPYPQAEPVIPADQSNSGNVASDVPVSEYGLPPVPIQDTYGPPSAPADTYGLPPN